mmetsp:Transcript_59579/g.158504  ORF Transcript_59579/g.158504 Transcript_59579/m.158504 type:complete len:187 (+) Transcript_59579:2817-3377(+)
MLAEAKKSMRCFGRILRAEANFKHIRNHHDAMSSAMEARLNAAIGSTQVIRRVHTHEVHTKTPPPGLTAFLQGRTDRPRSSVTSSSDVCVLHTPLSSPRTSWSTPQRSPCSQHREVLSNVAVRNRESMTLRSDASGALSRGCLEDSRARDVSTCHGRIVSPQRTLAVRPGWSVPGATPMATPLLQA